MTVAAFPRKVRIVPADSQLNSNFLDGLKSKEAFFFPALADGEVFRGKGLPPGPVWSEDVGWPSTLDAVKILWVVKAMRKNARRMIGET